VNTGLHREREQTGHGVGYRFTERETRQVRGELRLSERERSDRLVVKTGLQRENTQVRGEQ